MSTLRALTACRQRSPRGASPFEADGKAAGQIVRGPQGVKLVEGAYLCKGPAGGVGGRTGGRVGEWAYFRWSRPVGDVSPKLRFGLL